MKDPLKDGLALEAATGAATALGVAPKSASRGTQLAVQAGNQPTRFFHTVAHFADLMAGSRDIATKLRTKGIGPDLSEKMAQLYAIAARDHDVVYTTADNGSIMAGIQEGIQPYFINTAGEYGIIDVNAIQKLPAASQQNLHIAMETFGFQAGAALDKFAGQNEFLSALHSLEVNASLTASSKVALAAIHQATIPFVGPKTIDQLAKRISKIQENGKPILTPDEVNAIGLTAADFANRDVAGFAGAADAFQKGSYELLREAGADLTSPTSIIECANRRADFFRGIHTTLLDGSKAIFRNFTFYVPAGSAVSLLDQAELDRLNGAAAAQLATEGQMLASMVQAASAALSAGNRSLGGSADGEAIRQAMAERGNATTSFQR